MRLPLVLLLAMRLTALADVPPPRLDVNSCEADGDCVLSTGAGCCGSCCPQAPRAETRSAAKRRMDRCAVIDCALPDCSTMKCAAIAFTPVRAVCRSRQCVTEPLRTSPPPPPPANECTSDVDCTVTTSAPLDAACRSSPCGCCPSPRAVPLSRAERAPQQAKDQARPQTTPEFGLSTGPAPQCSPCQASTAGARAACVGGRCVLGPVRLSK